MAPGNSPGVSVFVHDTGQKPSATSAMASARSWLSIADWLIVSSGGKGGIPTVRLQVPG
jgi:hypothetical protein